MSQVHIRHKYTGEIIYTYEGGTLIGANLECADLRGANLECADLCGAIGNSREIKSIQSDIWPIAYTATYMQIGCQNHPLESWWAFSDQEIAAMSPGALEWWRAWKPLLQGIIAASPAVPTVPAP